MQLPPGSQSAARSRGERNDRDTRQRRPTQRRTRSQARRSKLRPVRCTCRRKRDPCGMSCSTGPRVAVPHRGRQSRTQLPRSPRTMSLILRNVGDPVRRWPWHRVLQDSPGRGAPRHPAHPSPRQGAFVTAASPARPRTELALARCGRDRAQSVGRWRFPPGGARPHLPSFGFRRPSAESQPPGQRQSPS